MRGILVATLLAGLLAVAACSQGSGHSTQGQSPRSLRRDVPGSPKRRRPLTKTQPASGGLLR